MASGLSFQQLLDQLVCLNDLREKEIAELRKENIRLKADDSDADVFAVEAVQTVPADQPHLPEDNCQLGLQCEIHEAKGSMKIRLKADDSDTNVFAVEAVQTVPADQPHSPENNHKLSLHCEIHEARGSIGGIASSTSSPNVATISTRCSTTVSVKLRDFYAAPDLPSQASQDDIDLIGRITPLNEPRSDVERFRRATSQVSFQARACIILKPNDTRRILWDMVGMLLLCYDMVAIPLGAFALEQTLFLDVMDWTTQIYWTGDMVMSCLTGYVKDGKVVLQPSRIMVHYLKTWFALDLVVNVPEWITVLLSSGAQEGESGDSSATSLLRTMRMARSVRILRLVKLQRLISMIKDSISSESVFIGLNIFKLLMMLVLMNHFIASLWYIVGGLGDKPDTWIDRYRMHPGQASLGLRYTTSLHWSFTQFTPASSGIQPQNVFERSFAIVILMLGLVSSSSFISSITGSMSQLRNMTADTSKQFWLLRRYMKQQRVPLALSFKVLRYMEYVHANKRDDVSEGRIMMLNTLSDELKNQLRWVTTYNSLKTHALYEQMEAQSYFALTKLAGNGLKQTHFAADDYLFLMSDVPSQMHFIKEGFVRYTLATPKAADFDDRAEEVRDLGNEEYLCEIALWAVGRHVGRAKAIEETNVINVEVQAMLDMVRADMNIHTWLAPYARSILEFVELMEDARWFEISLPDITDFTRNYFANENRRLRRRRNAFSFTGPFRRTTTRASPATGSSA